MKDVAEVAVMQIKSSTTATVSAWATYISGIGVFFAESFKWIDSHAGACGVMIAFMSFLVNAYYRRQDHIVVCMTHDRRRNDAQR